MAENLSDSNAAGQRPFLLCRVRSVFVALPIEHVVETMRPLPVEPLSAMPGFVVGLAVVRGEPTPVVDVGVLLALHDGAQWTRFVTVRATPRPVVLAVEAVVGVRPLDLAPLRELPSLLGRASAEIIEAVGAHDRDLLVLLNTARVIPTPVWRSIDGAGARP